MLNRACREVAGFSELPARFERNISLPGRGRKTCEQSGVGGGSCARMRTKSLKKRSPL